MSSIRRAWRTISGGSRCSEKFAAESAENARIAQESIFGYQNSDKAITGYFGGLRDMAAMSQKKMSEQDQEKKYMEKHPQGPNPWEEIAGAMKVEHEFTIR